MNDMTTQNTLQYREPHRPQIHFSPPKNWMNDPNGMVFYKGVYHLFYQYNPGAHVWGNMHWGHATSTDLIHWEHRPIALHAEPEGLGFIFSGSAVVDWQNTTGLGSIENPPLIALFTHSSETGFQVQSLAYSLDEGESWHMYEKNPVLGNPGIKNFRDPKVIWDEQHQCWVMALAAESVIKFYSSKNLLAWQFLSDFGEGVGSHGGVWECPDLFPLQDAVSGALKWVLLVSEVSGAPNGGSGTQYFIGTFDGERFVPEQDEVLWLDYGPDSYAGVTWSDEPEALAKRTFIAWMSNWQYANETPTDPWRGAMTLPRELKFIATHAGLRLGLGVVDQLTCQADQESSFKVEHQVVAQPLVLYEAEHHSGGAALDISLSFDRASMVDGWRLEMMNQESERLLLEFNFKEDRLIVDRSSAAVGFNEDSDFCRLISAPLESVEETLLLVRIIRDCSSVEIIKSNGLSLVTSLFFTHKPLNLIQVSPINPILDETLVFASVEEMHGIW